MKNENYLLTELLAFPTVIVANGEAPLHVFAVEMLKSASHIVCCDGAVRHLNKLNIQPEVIVGDGDSLSNADLSNADFRIETDKSTDYNDLTKAFHYCRNHHYHQIAVLCATGLREDHTLGNISIMMNFAAEFQIVMVTNYGIFSPIHSTTTFQSFAGQQVSIFSFCADTALTFRQLKYPVQNRCFRHLWEGTSNEALTDFFTIDFQQGNVLVYRTFNLFCND
ncbi:MAG TPA: thiamine diphosphokinase [Bacteroidales bacterium]|nr:thiamine diphosphokinase [Bacteroidales bacterium]